MACNLRFDVLPDEQLRILEVLSSQSFIKDFYLAGGTGLALQIGHRQSYDFDFFTPADFSTTAIIDKLVTVGQYERDNEERNTINGSLNGVRISFFGYRYNIVDVFLNYNNIRLAGLRDIAAMKLEAIAGRGSRKDFIDMFFLLQQYTLEEILSFHALKYGVGLNNQYHHLKSLVYFTDAEEEAMPVMVTPIQWNEVKKFITNIVKKFRLQ
jgi:hypothetical protein